ncbi:MAG: hypothetical protein J7647_20205 [Cyanobacteria bacterium SBLK]|nr:hypothetical protein [Cyanobacteria bacterium SBLK]
MFRNLFRLNIIQRGTLLAGLLFFPNLQFGGDINPQSDLVTFPEYNRPVITQSSLPAFNQNGFVFQLQSCRRTTSEEITCEFLVKNEHSLRRQLSLYDALLIDSQGNAIDDYRFQFSNGDSSLILASKIPIRGRIVFRGVPQNTEWALIELDCNGAGKRFVGEFRSQ